MAKRRIKQPRTRVAGRGNDGELYGVTAVNVSESGYRKKPCATCPWRKDSPVGRFPAEAYRESAHTAYDANFSMFACHVTGVEHATTCAGFLLVNADNNIGYRLAVAGGKIDPGKIGNPDNVPLYESYRAMAEANGVDPDDPVLAGCRANSEPFDA